MGECAHAVLPMAELSHLVRHDQHCHLQPRSSLGVGLDDAVDFPLERHFGFNFVGVGTKTNPNWIFNWVKNPKSYDANAPMPASTVQRNPHSAASAPIASCAYP